MAQWVPQIAGAVLIGASLLTDYELGVVRMIPMPVHLGFDVAAGLLLAVSDWQQARREIDYDIVPLLTNATNQTDRTSKGCKYLHLAADFRFATDLDEKRNCRRPRSDQSLSAPR